jgi:acetyltransferase-like isoleucine patch superfamily enzyme
VASELVQIVPEAAASAAAEGAPSGPAAPAPAAPARRTLRARLRNRIVMPATRRAFQAPRLWKYRALSTCRPEGGKPKILQPVLFIGVGKVVLGEGVQFGWINSPDFYAGYCHVEVAAEGARIEVGDRTEFNNNLFLKSEGAGITIGADGLFGADVEIFDSDFHDLHPDRRHDGDQRMLPIEIGDNVYVGMGVRILKGASIGSNSVIGAGSVVTGKIPANVIAAGNPCRVIREL